MEKAILDMLRAEKETNKKDVINSIWLEELIKIEWPSRKPLYGNDV